jgi:molecular chaperone DnaK
MAEHGHKADSATRTAVTDAMKDLKQAMNGGDTSEIKRLTEVLTQASHKIAASMYQQSSAAGGQAHGHRAEGQSCQGTCQSNDDVIDADYQEVA